MKKETIQFLSNLRKHNNRDWFQENKTLYLDACEDVINFVEELKTQISAFDKDILKVDAKKALFRIYRDIRFSKDKSPYKTNFGVNLGIKNGGKNAGYYLHLEPGKSFLAGGIYLPESGDLKKIRSEIDAYGKEFLQIVNRDSFKKTFGGLSEEFKLKKVPHGYEKEHPMAEFLKLKSFVVQYSLTDKELFEKEAAKKFSAIYQEIKPLNDFLETAILENE